METYNVSINANYVFGFHDGYKKGYLEAKNNTPIMNNYRPGYMRGYREGKRSITKDNRTSDDNTILKFIILILLMVIVYMINYYKQ
jgi:hypothetical protein